MSSALTPNMQLCRLPKLAKLQALKWRGSVKGEIGPILGHTKFNKDEILDPQHPALRNMTSRGPRTPYYADPGGAFSARIVPNGVLGKSEFPFDEEGYHQMMEDERPPRPAPHGRRKDRIVTRMGWINIVGVQSVHKSAVIRSRVHSRMKAATALIITRGACPVPLSTPVPPKQGNSATTSRISAGSSSKSSITAFEPELVWTADDANPEKWTVPGWSYVFFPKVPLLRMPYPQMVNIMRQALEALKREALKLEATYAHLARTSAKPSMIHDTASRKPTERKVREVETPARAASSRPRQPFATQGHKPKYPSMALRETASVRIQPLAEDELQDENAHKDFIAEMEKLRDALPLSPPESQPTEMEVSSSRPKPTRARSDLSGDKDDSGATSRRPRHSTEKDMEGADAHRRAQDLTAQVCVRRKTSLRPKSDDPEPGQPSQWPMLRPAVRLFRAQPLVMQDAGAIHKNAGHHTRGATNVKHN